MNGNQEINKIGRVTPDLYQVESSGSGAILVIVDPVMDFRPVSLSIATDSVFSDAIDVELTFPDFPAGDIVVLHYEDGFQHSFLNIFEGENIIKHPAQIQITSPNSGNVEWSLCFTYEIL